MRFALFTAVLAAVAAAAPAQAQFYTQFKAGTVRAEDMHFEERSTVTMNVDNSAGWRVSGAAGYALPALPLRAEVELGYHRNDVEGSFLENIQTIVACGLLPSSPCLSGRIDDGRLASLSTMGNVYFDIPMLGPISPYIGAGLGMTRVKLRAVSEGIFSATDRRPVTVMDDSDSVVAARAVAGFAVGLGPVDLTVDYSYGRTARPELNGGGPNVPFVFDRRLVTHSVNAGLRLSF